METSVGETSIGGDGIFSAIIPVEDLDEKVEASEKFYYAPDGTVYTDEVPSD